MNLAAYRRDFVRRFNSAVPAIDGWYLSSYIRSESKQAALREQGLTTAVYSQHLTGLAADIAPDKRPTGRVTSRSRAASILRRAGLVVLDHGNHLHAQRLPANEYLRLIGRR